MKKALITGIAGQDGSYLAEYLLGLGYEVHGIVRRNSTPENQSSRLDPNLKNLYTHYGDLLDISSINKVLLEVKPDEIYNLAAQSHVRISYDIPQFTVQTNALGVLNILEAFRQSSPKSRFYQASSSEMFGSAVDDDGYQRETTPFKPVSPYGCAKVFGFNLTKHYRKAYKIFAVNGILFNHESKRRGSNFVTSKVVKTAVRIKHQLEKELVLGNMDSSRDWGHSKDYVNAMHLILTQDEPDDYVVATGQTRTVRELCEYVFSKLNLDLEKYLKTSEKFMRPEELRYLKGDSSKIRKKLKWKPKYSFENLIDEMIEFWEEHYSNDNINY